MANLNELLAAIADCGPEGPDSQQWAVIRDGAAELAEELAERSPKAPDLSTLDRSCIAHVGPPPGPKSND